MRVQPWVHETCVFVSPNNFPHFSSSDETSTANDYSQLASSVTRSRKKLRALVVDDVLDVAEMLRVLLTQAGFDVVTADSAYAAIDAAREQRFDVIVSDIGMPGMNGYELARVLRRLPRYKSVPMIAVSGYAEFNDRREALSAGFTAQMTKPIDPQSLLDLLEDL